MTNGTLDNSIVDFSEQRLLRTAVTIRQQIRTTEASGDQMLENSAELMKAMVAARRHSAVDPHLGQHAIMRLAKAQQAIISAQNDIFRVHDELVKIQTVMMPDEDGSTPPSGLSDADTTSFEGGSAVA